MYIAWRQRVESSVKGAGAAWVDTQLGGRTGTDISFPLIPRNFFNCNLFSGRTKSLFFNVNTLALAFGIQRAHPMAGLQKLYRGEQLPSRLRWNRGVESCRGSCTDQLCLARWSLRAFCGATLYLEVGRGAQSVPLRCA